jgi:hypothetical protein
MTSVHGPSGDLDTICVNTIRITQPGPIVSLGGRVI